MSGQPYRMLYQISRGAKAAHEALGAGRTVAEYMEVVNEFMAASNEPFTYKAALPVHYKGVLLPHTFPADFTVRHGAALVYIVSLPEEVPKWMRIQLFYKMRASRIPVGAIFNLGRE